MQPAQAATQSVALPASTPAPDAVSFGENRRGVADLDCDLLMLGGGPGGHSAACLIKIWQKMNAKPFDAW